MPEAVSSRSPAPPADALTSPARAFYGAQRPETVAQPWRFHHLRFVVYERRLVLVSTGPIPPDQRNSFDQTIQAWGQTIRTRMGFEHLVEFSIDLATRPPQPTTETPGKASPTGDPLGFLFRQISSLIDEKSDALRQRWGEDATIAIALKPGRRHPRVYGSIVDQVNRTRQREQQRIPIHRAALQSAFAQACRADPTWWEGVIAFRFQVRLQPLTAHRRLEAHRGAALRQAAEKPSLAGVAVQALRRLTDVLRGRKSPS
jgi:hypothetical protein